MTAVTTRRDGNGAGFPTPFVELDRADWSRLRENHPMSLTTADLTRLRGIHHPLDLREVEQVYLPLSRLLTFYFEATDQLPGMSSLLSIGGSAVARARGLADRQLEGVLGEAMGKGGELAVRRVNAALLGVLRTGPVRGAVLESWDLEADEPIASLTADLPPGGVRRLAEAVYALVAGAADTAYGDVVIDTCVEVLLERHGDDDIAGLLTTLGLERADLGEALDRALRPALDTLHATGDLERIIRTGIEPFYASDEVRRLLADVPRRSTRRPRQTGGERADP